MNLSYCEDVISTGTTITGDADISGIGVLLAFTLSAYFTFAAVLLAYLFGQVEGALLNDVDTTVLRIRPAVPHRHKALKKGLRHAILALGDQQIVTGIAILASGFHGLQKSNITTYHFHIILYLAWMSSSVHLSALSFLRDFFSENRPLLLWRIVGMLTLMVLLIIGFIPTVSNDWGIEDPWDETEENLTGWGVPASCFFGHLYGDGVNPDAVFAFLLLVVSYAWKAGGQFQTIRSNYDRYIRSPMVRWSENMLAQPAKKYTSALSRRKLPWLWIFRLVLAVFVPVNAIIEVSASFSASIWLSLLGLIYGSMQIWIPRSQVLYMTASSETKWGFGQLVPLFLLVQPVGTIIENVGKKVKHSEPAKKEEVSPSTSISAPTQDHYQRQRLSGTLLQYLSRDEAHPNQSNNSTALLRSMLFRSRLYKLGIWLVHGAMIGTSVTVFYFDYYTIGYYTSDNWSVILIFIGGYWGATFLMILVLSPFSWLGRQPP